MTRAVEIVNALLDADESPKDFLKRRGLGKFNVEIKRYGPRVVGRMRAAKAKDWSDTEIERCLGPMVIGLGDEVSDFFISLAKIMRGMPVWKDKLFEADEAPKDFLKRHYSTAVLLELEKMGWRCASKSKYNEWSVYWLDFGPVLVQRLEPLRVRLRLSVSARSVEAELVNLVALGTGQGVAVTRMIGQPITADSIKWLDLKPVLAAWASKQTTEPPETEAEIPTYNEFRTSWNWMRSQLDLRKTR